MANLNRVILAGNLTRDPDARRTNSGTSVCKLGLAVNRRFRSQSGEQREETTFIDIDVWGQSADFCRDYLRKGSPVLIEGRLRMDSWEDKATGQQRSKLVVVAERVQSLGGRSDGGQQQGGGYQQHSQPQQQQGWNAPQQQAAPQAPAPPPFPSAPQGQAPQGQAPQGQAPQGQAPQGQAPQGQAPQGQAPQGQAPAGTPAADDAFDVSDESIDDIPF